MSIAVERIVEIARGAVAAERSQWRSFADAMRDVTLAIPADPNACSSITARALGLIIRQLPHYDAANESSVRDAIKNLVNVLALEAMNAELARKPPYYTDPER